MFKLCLSFEKKKKKTSFSKTRQLRPNKKG